MTEAEAAALPRLILFHKQATSARTRFLRFAGTVLAFAPLPAGARLRGAAFPAVLAYPADCLRQAERHLGLAEGSLAPVRDYYADVDTDDGVVPVLLAQCTAIDPPFAAAERVGGRFVALTEARDLPDLELQLLRRAYELLIG